MPPRLHIVDVFARGPYTGNPLAVVSDPGDLDAHTMQRIAFEMNFSETTFICGGDSSRGFDVRIFTPKQELPFAGHPTLIHVRTLPTPDGLRVRVGGRVSTVVRGELA